MAIPTETQHQEKVLFHDSLGIVIANLFPFLLILLWNVVPFLLHGLGFGTFVNLNNRFMFRVKENQLGQFQSRFVSSVDDSIVI